MIYLGKGVFALMTLCVCLPGGILRVVKSDDLHDDSLRFEGQLNRKTPEKHKLNLVTGSRVKRGVRHPYEDSFWLNEGWFVRDPPPGPSGYYGNNIPSNYYPNPRYGVLTIMLLPIPTPPPLSKHVSPQVSNFAGYVGPIKWDDDDDK